MSVRGSDDAVVTRLHALGPALGGDPDPEFRTTTRTRLVAIAAVRTPGPPPRSARRRQPAVRSADAPALRWRARLTAGLAGATLTVTALAALVAVAHDARPGDMLYDVKRSTEQTQLAMAGDSRGRTLLDFASTRLDELAELVGDDDGALPGAGGGPGDAPVSATGADPALVLATLRSMDEHTQEGAAWLTERAVDARDATQLDRLARWADAQAEELTALQPLVPGEAAGAVGGSLGLLADIDVRTDGLQGVLGCTGGPAVAGTDDLGPVPGACPAALQTPSGPAGTQPQPPGTAPVATPPATAPALEPEPVPPTPGAAAPSPPVDPIPSPPADPAPSPPVDPAPSGPPPPVTLPPAIPAPPTPAPPSAVIQAPPLGPIQVCLPPLITIGC
jgi:hypothetical protein